MNKLCSAAIAGILALVLGMAAAPIAAQPTSPTLVQEAPADHMSFNFQDAQLTTVLDAMSRTLGLAVVQEAPVSGRVNVVSHQPLNVDESVALLNTILNEKGYAGVRSERTLTIVRRDDARTRNIPVRVGGDPQAIASTDEMVTQIIPVRHAKAEEMIEDLQGLLPTYARITANESSNAIVLTDTQNNIRRVASIVMALDQSISEISSIRVFQLSSADAKETAALITAIFTQDTASSSRGDSRRFFRPPFMRGGDDENNNEDSDSAALQASSRVTAAADERTNSVVVGAPDALMPTIESLVNQLDKSVAITTEVRVFPLQYSSAESMAQTIAGIFNTQGTTSSSSNNREVRRFSGRNRPPEQNAGSSDRSSDTTVLAVADTRTNSVIVSAISETMNQIAGVIAELDKNPANTKKVYIYPLQNADPEDVANMLEQMFNSSGTTSNTRRNTNNSNTTTRNTNTRNTNNSTRNNSSRSGSSR
jgi:general secretion pathway protein D